MNKSKKSPIEAFEALSDAEKERQYRAIDRQFSRAETQPLTPKQRQAWRKFQQRRQRRTQRETGESATVSLKIESRLLKRADAFAKREGVTRSQIIARGLELLLRAS